eukprot:scaffold3775_cov182-Pinguiococcus_pyrenoidosus.AAC.3
MLAARGGSLKDVMAGNLQRPHLVQSKGFDFLADSNFSISLVFVVSLVDLWSDTLPQQHNLPVVQKNTGKMLGIPQTVGPQNHIPNFYACLRV